MAVPQRQWAESASIALQIASKFEPKVREAIEAAFRLYRDSVTVARIEAYIKGGDLAGLAGYLAAKFGPSAAMIVRALDQAVNAAGAAAAADINAALAATGKTLASYLPAPLPGVPAQVVFQGVTDSFSYNPANVKTIQAVRTWQGALIQQMTDAQRRKILDSIRDGLVLGENPRTIALRIREGLPLTASQNRAVINFNSDLSRIVENGIRSATSWGIYTPRQMAEMKASNPAAFRRMNFSATELVEGRRWAKISRAAGTLAYDPIAGAKPAKPIGFVKPSGTQGGPSAYRILPDGTVIDGMTEWRLRDKRFDPLIYDVVSTQEGLRDAEFAVSGARTAAEKDAATDALRAAQAKYDAARMNLGAEQARMVDRYRDRFLKYRSETIARTEAMRAANLGSYESWRQAIEDSDLFEPEEVKRQWMTAKDDRVRLDHRGAAGQKVGINEPFMVGGDAVMFPPHQPNCRCTVGYAIDLGATAGATP